MTTEDQLAALTVFTHELLAALPTLRERLFSTPQPTREPPLFSPDFEHQATVPLAQSPHLLGDAADTPSSRMKHISKVRLSATGGNYSTWKTAVEILLTAEPNCYEVTMGTLKTDNPEYTKANALARAILLNSIDIQLIKFKFKLTVATATAADIYREITEEFDNVTEMAQHTIMLKIQTFKFQSNKNPYESVQRFRALVDKAIDAGAQVNDTSLVPSLLQALPNSWVWLKQSWSSVSDKTITNLYAHIDQEQFRLESEACTAQIDPRNTLAIYYSEIPTRRNQFEPNYRAIQHYRPSNNNHGRRNFNPSNSNRQSQPRFQNNRYPNQQPRNQNPRYNANQAQSSSQNPNNQAVQPYQPRSSNNNNSQNTRNRGSRGRGRYNNQNRNPGPRAHLAEAQTPNEPFYSPEIFCSTTSNESDPSSWWIDSGASEHFCRSQTAFFDYEELSLPLTVRVGGSQTLQAVGSGTVLLQVQSQSDQITLTLRQVLHVPGLRKNLVSVSALLRDGWTVRADSSTFTLSKDEIEIHTQPSNGLFVLHAQILLPSFTQEAFLSVLKRNPSLQQAHEALGHINKATVQNLLRRYGLNYKNEHEDCESCLKGKMNRVSYRTRPLSSRPN